MKNDFLRIDTPRGSIVQRKSKGGSVSARLVWADDFGQKRTKQFTNAQMSIDSEVLRYSSRYIPKRTGMLDASGRLGTILGTGEVRYIAPYAKDQYYHTAPTRSYDNDRGSAWFERMKLRHKDAIIRVVKNTVGAK